ncbi:cytochrome P450 4c3-like [Coccinella septempunctata]|uniref:cytochrome P450 4c3-like n=1 Tax=Coccinella septempunctata TaxID=41139 RepID=UPI001D0932C3|nr:cytochrome P450 4c3-like [Coccinella septempunctata]
MLIAALLLGILLIFLFTQFGRLKNFLRFVKHVKKLPRRKGYPLVGNILDLLGGPEEVFRKLTLIVNESSRNGIAVIWMTFFPLILVSEPNVLEQVLRSPVNNTKGVIYNMVRPWLNDGLLTSNDKKWHTRRKMLTPAFHFNILQKFLHIFNEESRLIVDSLKGHSHNETDASKIISKFTLDTICETAMGTKLSELANGEKYRWAVREYGIMAIDRVAKTWLLVDAIHRFSKYYRKHIQVLDILHEFTRTVIDARQKTFISHEEISINDDSSKKKEPMLDLLISAQRRGEDIDDEGIREEVDTFVFEGHDTTAVALSFSLMLLANNRECQDKIYEELKSVFGDDDRDPTASDLQELRYLERCIKETLRLYPSVPKISRKTEEDIILDGGLIIPKDSTLLIMIYEMHRRADLYPNPEKFDPDRFLPENVLHKHPYAYIPFSAGPRNCIGQKFAMMEMKSFLTAILRNYILEPIDTPETIQCIADLVLRTKYPIKVRFIRRTD